MQIKDIALFFEKKGTIFSKLETINLKALGIRKRVLIYKALDIKSNYHLIVVSSTKSRFVVKNAHEIEMIYTLLKDEFGHNFRYKELIISNPLCSKANKRLKELGWRVSNAAV